MENEKNTRIFKILHLYLKNRFSSETEEEVQRWIIRKDHSPEKQKTSLVYWDALNSNSDASTFQALKRVNKRIGLINTSHTIPIYQRLLRIAVIIIPAVILVSGIYYFSQREQMIQVITAYGETKQIILPDSSQVWLNAGSTFRYPSRFKDVRHVDLVGEAYFSVKEGKAKPFIVQTKELSVKVLGTKFNIKAYIDEEKIIATLVTGKVEVSTNRDSYILKPNEQLTYDRNTSIINVAEVRSDETDSWISGQLVFNNNTLTEIIQTLERRFGISITNRTAIPSSKLYTVKFLKNETIDEVLNILENVVGFSYQRHETNIILK